jgi:hypothetical protein
VTAPKDRSATIVVKSVICLATAHLRPHLSVLATSASSLDMSRLNAPTRSALYDNTTKTEGTKSKSNEDEINPFISRRRAHNLEERRYPGHLERVACCNMLRIFDHERTNERKYTTSKFRPSLYNQHGTFHNTTFSFFITKTGSLLRIGV